LAGCDILVREWPRYPATKRREAASSRSGVTKCRGFASSHSRVCPPPVVKIITGGDGEGVCTSCCPTRLDWRCCSTCHVMTKLDSSINHSRNLSMGCLNGSTFIQVTYTRQSSSSSLGSARSATNGRNIVSCKMAQIPFCWESRRHEGPSNRQMERSDS